MTARAGVLEAHGPGTYPVAGKGKSKRSIGSGKLLP